MTEEIGVAIVGAGMAGQAHAFGYRNASMTDELAGVRPVIRWIIDPQVSLAELAANRCGAERFSGDLADALNDEKVDVVSVAIPNHLYAETIPQVLRAGKHLLAEKPLGSSLGEAIDMARLANAQETVTGVGFSYRRVPALGAIREHVRAGRIGDVHQARGFYYTDYAADPSAPYTWRFGNSTSGGGAVMDIGPHVFDGLVSVLGPARRIASSVEKTVIATRLDRSGASRDVENDDVSMTTIEFNSGAVATVELSRISHGNRNRVGFEYFGDRGSLTFDTLQFDEYRFHQAGDRGPTVVTSGPDDPYFSDVSSFRVAGVGTGYGEAFIAEIQEFLVAVVSGRRMDTDFSNALHTMAIVDAAQRSAASGEAVEVAQLGSML